MSHDAGRIKKLRVDAPLWANQTLPDTSTLTESILKAGNAGRSSLSVEVPTSSQHRMTPCLTDKEELVVGLENAETAKRESLSCTPRTAGKGASLPGSDSSDASMPGTFRGVKSRQDGFCSHDPLNCDTRILASIPMDPEPPAHFSVSSADHKDQSMELISLEQQSERARRKAEANEYVKSVLQPW